MTEIIVDLNIEDTRWIKDLPNISDIVSQVKEVTFGYMSKHNKFRFSLPSKPLQINVALSNDDTVQKLNRDFRGKDKPTNVLSFANIDSADFLSLDEMYDTLELGDIIIAYETMHKESEIENISLHDHFCHLLCHGFLHLSGYDHQTDSQAEEMESLEIAILRQLNIANPYQEKE